MRNDAKMLRNTVGAVLATFAGITLVISTPAAANGNPQGHVPGGLVGQLLIPGYMDVPGDECFNGKWKPKSEEVAQLRPAADAAIHRYLNIASAGGDVSSAFVKQKMIRDWRLDGVPGGPRKNFTGIRDPWAARIARLEQTSFIVGNGHERSRAIWNAYDANGIVLGTYDALFRNSKRGAELLWLYLYTPTTAVNATPSTPFCKEPGDIELFWAIQARKQAERAAKGR